jgi:hypothetical protein
MKKISHPVAIVLLIVGCLAVPGPAMIIEMSLPELVSNSDAVVRGEVTKTECRWIHPDWDPNSRIIVTDVTLTVLNSIKGKLDNTEVIIETPGGEIGDTGLWVEDAPRFRPGEETIVFLGPENPQGMHSVTNSCNGKYTIADGIVLEKNEPVSRFVRRTIQVVRDQDGRKR